jgi:hypothetical protein
MAVQDLNERELHIILKEMEFFMTMPFRYHIMRCYPQIYNKWMGEDIVKVVQISDGTDI